MTVVGATPAASIRCSRSSAASGRREHAEIAAEYEKASGRTDGSASISESSRSARSHCDARAAAVMHVLKVTASGGGPRSRISRSSSSASWYCPPRSHAVSAALYAATSDAPPSACSSPRSESATGQCERVAHARIAAVVASSGRPQPLQVPQHVERALGVVELPVRLDRLDERARLSGGLGGAQGVENFERLRPRAAAVGVGERRRRRRGEGRAGGGDGGQHFYLALELASSCRRLLAASASQPLAEPTDCPLGRWRAVRTPAR